MPKGVILTPCRYVCSHSLPKSHDSNKIFGDFYSFSDPITTLIKTLTWFFWACSEWVINVRLIRPNARPAQPGARVPQVCARSLSRGCVLPVLPGDDRCWPGGWDEVGVGWGGEFILVSTTIWQWRLQIKMKWNIKSGPAWAGRPQGGGGGDSRLVYRTER